MPRYLLFHYTPAQNTLFENIFKLPAAHNLIFDLDKFIVMLFGYNVQLINLDDAPSG